jgi:hypothetical protein
MRRLPAERRDDYLQELLVALKEDAGYDPVLSLGEPIDGMWEDLAAENMYQDYLRRYA